jgi:hypothetical protein
MDAVACPAVDVCFAADNVSPGLAQPIEPPEQVTGVDRWNGRRWSRQMLPHPAGTTSLQPGRIACASTRACIAVGYAGSIGAARPLAERWDGSSWKLLAVPGPVGAAGGAIGTVSCPSANWCLATAFALDRFESELSLTFEVWNGSRWTVLSTATPAGQPPATIADLSCVTIAACVAVGTATSAAGNSSPFDEVWNGTSWSVQPVPSRPGAEDTSLVAVSCAAGGGCLAAGSSATASSGDLPDILVERGS